MTVNILSRARLRGQLVVSVKLETDPEGSAEIKSLEPKLRDHYNARLMRLGQSLLDVRQPLDLRRIQSSLQGATDAVLGNGVATVLLTSAMVRR